MRKLLLLVALLAALVAAPSASPWANSALIKLPGGANCTPSTNPPCQLVSQAGSGVLNTQSVNYSPYTEYFCGWWYPAGSTCGDVFRNVVGILSAPLDQNFYMHVYARRSCPTGGGTQFSDTKTMLVNSQKGITAWFGWLQIEDQGGCQPALGGGD